MGNITQNLITVCLASLLHKLVNEYPQKYGVQHLPTRGSEIKGVKSKLIEHIGVLLEHLDLLHQRIVNDHDGEGWWLRQRLSNCEFFQNSLLLFYLQDRLHIIQHHVEVELIQSCETAGLLSHLLQRLLQTLQRFQHSLEVLAQLEGKLIGLLLRQNSTCRVALIVNYEFFCHSAHCCIDLLACCYSNQLLAIELNTVDVNHKTAGVLLFDKLHAILHEGGLTATVRPMHEYVRPRFQQCHKELNVAHSFCPSLINDRSILWLPLRWLALWYGWILIGLQKVLLFQRCRLLAVWL